LDVPGRDTYGWAPMTTPRRLALACNDYDRTRALRDGRVVPDGVELTYLPLVVEETFFRMMRHREFDVAELSLSSYVLSLDDADPPFVAIPVFPSRSFRHSSVYSTRDGAIREPADLAGGRVGLAEYQLTANVWIRGILAEHHGLPFDSVTYVTGGLEDPRRIEKRALDLPDKIRVERAPQGRCLAQMLDAGELDAIYSPRAPSTFGQGRVVRLFDDVRSVERAYFEATRLFPIMHTIVLRRDLYEDARWLAQSLYKAFDAALGEVRAALHDTTALRYSLPWLVAHAEETEALMGPNPWAYGLGGNVENLAAFLRYSHEQGLARKLRAPEELFAPETLESFAL
jgi:4,5-dihydroxyphthalate decarboxylase